VREAGVDRRTPVPTSGKPDPSLPPGDLETIGRFSSRARADEALGYLERAGMRTDHLHVRMARARPRQARGRVTRLAVEWLRQHEPETLTAPTEPVWELAGPAAVAAAARAVLASNGQAFAPYVRT
jgi:hypothetical protein